MMSPPTWTPTGWCSSEPEVPCYCVHSWCLIVEAVEVAIFIVCLILSVIYSRVDKLSIILSIFISAAYIIHFLQDLLVFLSPHNCVLVSSRISFTSFLP